MTLRRILVVIGTALICMNITFQCSVSSDPPDWVIDLQVPYHYQLYCNYCGIACVQMWAHFDGWEVAQDSIASYVGITPGSYAANPYQLERAVGAYTGAYGYLERREFWEPGAQGDLISSTIEGLKYCVPSIMPFSGNHAVLIKGSEWNEKTDGSPLAKRIYLHDPNNLPSQNISADELTRRFIPCPFDYWVIVGWEDFILNGIIGHDTFVLMGGTYYGGPSYYNPKDLDLDIELK